MKIDRQVYLVLERLETGKHVVKIVDDLKDALVIWKSSTRVSPLFPITFTATDLHTSSDFEDSCSLILIGPIHPEKLLAAPAPDTRAWIGYGLLNVVVATTSKAEEDRLLKVAKSQSLAFERWSLKDGVITKVTAAHTGNVGALGKRLATLSSKSFGPEVREAIHEFCPLMASTLARSNYLSVGIRENLAKIQDYVDETIEDAEASGADFSSYQLLGQMLTLNAGLSRFSSQTFAGTIPIAETECHFWSHSLLGIGLASIGLWRVTDFIENKLGQARLPERLDLLNNIRTGIPDLRILDVNNEFWILDHLKSVVPKGKPDQIVPLLPYFSARDGFRSTSTTISAPLASVTSCNSSRWSLLTITHEISHVIIRGMLATLYPDLNEPAEIASAIKWLDSNGSCDTLLEEVRRLLLTTILTMEHPEPDEISVDDEYLVRAIESRHHEVEEIFVHTFDFLYFYGKDLDKYINGIWASWGTIPNIATRVPDYVVRSICAVLSKHIRRPDGELFARDSVVEALKRLHSNGIGGKYVDTALNYIKTHWNEIRIRVLARKGLIQIALAFFFSESIATSVRGEPAISGGASEKEGYTLQAGQLDSKLIANPLRFLELYSTSKQSSAMESLWIYYVLGFCVRF